MSSPQEPGRNVSKNRRLAHFAKAALSVTPAQVKAHVPTILDVDLATALLAGAVSIEELAEHTHRDAETISDALTDQVRAAYIFGEVHRLAHHRVGHVVAAVLRKAVGGDVKACELYLKLFGKLADLHVVAHTGPEDFSQFSDEELRAQVRAEVIGVIDVESGAAGGESAAGTEGAQTEEGGQSAELPGVSPGPEAATGGEEEEEGRTG